MVQTYVARLRKVFAECESDGSVTISYRSGGYLLTIDADLIDLHRFRRLVESSGNDVDNLRHALELWRGEPLAGLKGDWADGMRSTLLDYRLAAQRKLLEAQLASDDHAGLLRQLDELLTGHPLDETLIGHRMLALHRAGRQAEALSYYRDARSRLLAEIGDEPGPELRELHQKLLNRDPALAVPSPARVPSVHRTILIVDVEGFGDPRRTNPRQIAVRDGVYRVLSDAFHKAGIPWSGCDHEDRGDGVLVLAPPEVPKGAFVETLPDELVRALKTHNDTHSVEEHIRLRMALHAGEVNYDDHGVTAEAINLAFRLIEGAPLRAALGESPGVLAIITSSWFFDDVVRHSPTGNAASYRPVRVVLKESDVIGWVHLPDHPYPQRHPMPAEPDVVVPRQLPPSTPYFVGRDEEQLALTSFLEESDDHGTVVITAVNGTAGVGKTALALHWAHRIADRFPDGQLYANLRGFDDSGDPAPPAEVIRAFLAAFDIPPSRVPPTLDAQAALLRSLLVDRKLLVLLDNARDTDQVRPLLPGGRDCLVLVTSRNELAGLVTQEGARPLTLDVLSELEATTLLTRRLGPDRVTAERDAVPELIEYCARLPLAMSVVSARAQVRLHLPLHALVDELRDEHGRLDALTTGESATDVRGVFHWSYRQLPPNAARMFRLLGLHPGPDVSMHAAAGVAGVALREARAALHELARVHLLAEHAPGRFAFHDLLRTYAREQAHNHDGDNERHACMHRILDHYLRTAYAADRLLYPHRDSIVLPPQQDAVAAADLADARQAFAWLESELATLLAAVKLAADNGFGTYAWQIHWSTVTFLQRHGHWHELAASAEIALTAARQQDDRQGQAHARSGLAHALVRLGEHGKAQVHLECALSLLRDSGDLVGQARTHLEVDWMFCQQARHQDALEHALRALELYEAAGHRAGQAGALNDIGWCQAQLGEHDQALAHCRQALELHRELGNRFGEACTWDSVGYAHFQLGEHTQAVIAFHQALSRYRELSHRYEEAVTLGHLAETHHCADNTEAAREFWCQALAILEDLRHPRAEWARAAVRDLDRCQAL